MHKMGHSLYSIARNGAKEDLGRFLQNTENV